MLVMENSEEVMQILERYTKLKPKDIPKELEDYLCYVAKTGDTVYRWSYIKYLFREKLVHVIKEFHDTTPSVDDLPQYPNVDPFNYETMKSALLERVDLFNAAPFTIQRLCELLTDPRKQYIRIDKYMRALEKNILVVSTIEPGRKQADSENGDSLDSVVNGDLSLDVNVEIDMESESIFSIESSNINTDSSSVKSEHAEQIAKRVKLEKDGNEEVKVSTEKPETSATISFEEVKTKDETKEENSLTEADSSTKKLNSEEACIEKAHEEPKPNIPNIQEEIKTDLSEKLEQTYTEIPDADEGLEQEDKPKIANESAKKLEQKLGTESNVSKDQTNEVSIDEPASISSPNSTDDRISKKITEPVEIKSKSDEAIPNLLIVVDTKISEKATEEVEPKIGEDNIAETAINETSIVEPVIKIPEEMSVEETAPLLLDAQDCSPIPPAAVSITSAQQIIPDQPMDENLETVVSSTSQPDVPCLDEVIMQTETEMTTDPDTGKADPAVMEVDDTSQEEAMDQ